VADSEWGKINSGQPWGVVAFDVDRALARARMTDHEQVVMQFVREYSWGSSTRRKPPGKAHPWPDATPAEWRPRELALRMGVDHARLCQAKARLVGSLMLVEDKAGLQINKNADRWIFPKGHPRAGQRRLDAAAIAYAMASRPVDSGADSSTRVVRTAAPVGADSSTTPYKDRARVLDPTGLDKEDTPSVCVDAGDARTDPTPHLLSPEDQALVEDAAQLAEDWFPMRELGIAIGREANRFNSRQPGSFHPSWLRPALEKLRAQPRNKHTWPYLLGILGGFASDGGPSTSPVVSAAARSVHARRTALRDNVLKMDLALPKGFGDAN
jgi:hypothetical protein